MARADVVVIGAGLAGLAAATRLAEAGVSVRLVAKGHASTHWAAGGLDLGLLPGCATAADGVAELAGRPEHPYAFLGGDVAAASAWLLDRLARAGLRYTGDVSSPVRHVPTAIGGTRLASILPDAQSAALRPWEAGETLVVAGPAGFKDYWPAAIAGSLARPGVWMGGDRPSRVVGVAVELPGLDGRRNLNALTLARSFDDVAWRAPALSAIARAVRGAAPRGPVRIALPAVVGLEHHAEALADARRHLPGEPFEVPLVPPSVPGMRLFGALRDAIRSAGGGVQIGERVARIERDGDRATVVRMEAAARTFPIRTSAVILATGGLLGGGLVATQDETIVEPLLGLPVEHPPAGGWLAADALDPAGHPVEAAGIRTDADLRPVSVRDGVPLVANVRIVGGLLAGQRALRERCGDGVAVASGWRAAGLVAAELAGAGMHDAIAEGDARLSAGAPGGAP